LTSDTRRQDLHGKPVFIDLVLLRSYRRLTFVITLMTILSFAFYPFLIPVTSNIVAQPFQDPAFKVHAFPVTTSSNNGNSTEPVRDLLDGKSITLDNGIVLQPDEVTSPAPFTPNFLVLDCPTEDFIPALSENEALLSTLGHKPEDEPALYPGLSFIVHIVPQGMFSSEVYQKFVQKLTKVATESFRPDELPACQLPSSQQATHSIHHLVLDGSGCIPPLSGLYSQSTILHHFFDRDVYPLLYDCRLPHRLQEIHSAMSQTPDPNASVVYGQPRLQYRIRPWAGFTNLPYETLDSERLLDETFDPLYVTREEAEIRFSEMLNSIPVDLLPKERHSSTNHGSGGDAPATSVEDTYPEITFLGTASSSPNKYQAEIRFSEMLNSIPVDLLPKERHSSTNHGSGGDAPAVRTRGLTLGTLHFPLTVVISATSVEDAYPEITFLGTASSSPNKYRNISCILVQLKIVTQSLGVGSINIDY
ncbi:hypothetical protein X801_05550, partial [Opisthorchis viverrini]